MDVLLDCRYFIDIDRYRNTHTDWETLALFLSTRDVYLILAGWFSFDRADTFDALGRGFKGKLYRYEGGNKQKLNEFISELTFKIESSLTQK